jgi:DUF4097 and DUF4098 domain-containing protein YvlB
MHRRIFFGFAFAGLALVLLAAASPARADDWSKSYKLTGHPTLRLTTNDGHVDLYASDAAQIDAHVSTTGWPIGDSGVKITESQSGDTVTIDVHVPSSNWHLFGGNSNRSVRVEIHAPRDVDLDVQTGDGSITSEPFHGNLRYSTGDGNIEAHGLKGQLRMHSGDGNIEADDLDGTLRADSGDGRLEVSGRFDALDLESGDGSVTASAQAGSQMTGNWSLRSGDGSVTLRVADGLNADLDAHTGDGHITLDFPVTVSGSLSRSTIRGKLGSGGPPLVLRSGDGSIHLEKI